MQSLEAYLVDAGVLRTEQIRRARQQAQREGVSLWEALHAQDSEFIARALEPKRAYYYQHDAQQFQAARETGQPLNLRNYFPPNLQRTSWQESVERFVMQLILWGFAPVAWMEKRAWVVCERFAVIPTVLRTFLFTKCKLHRLPAPNAQIDAYRQMLRTYLWDVVGTAGPIIRIADEILQQAVHQHASVIQLEPQSESLTVRYFTDGAWMDILTLPTFITTPLMLRYKYIGKMRIQVEPVEDFGRLPMRYQNRDYDLALFTRVVNGQEQMYIHFVREKPVEPRIGAKEAAS